MALQVNADAVRALIPNGIYSLQVLEQRDHQRVVITLSLASHGGGHIIQIETTEAQSLALFQQLLTTAAQATQQRKRSQTSRKQAPPEPETRQPSLITVAASNPQPAANAQPQRRRRSRSKSAV
jgi:predicted ATP-dependent protease